MMTVYLAGGMENLKEADAKAWRDYAEYYLSENNIYSLDPCRRLAFHSLPHTNNLSKKVVALDFQDIKSSNLVLANIQLGRCWGTVIEIYYAYSIGIPVVTVMKEGDTHPFIETFSTEVYYNLDKALESVVSYNE